MARIVSLTPEEIGSLKAMVQPEEPQKGLPPAHIEKFIALGFADRTTGRLLITELGRQEINFLENSDSDAPRPAASGGASARI